MDGYNFINISYIVLLMFDIMIWVKGLEIKDGIMDFFDNEFKCKINIKELSLGLYSEL